MILLLPGVAAASPAPSGGQVVLWAELEGVISSFSVDYVREALRTAERDEAECLVLELDTPGGLLDSARALVKDILGARVPVVVWVGPAGARAASAGTFITLAAHVAAMAPATNIGAAHPVHLSPGGFPAPGERQPERDADPRPGAPTPSGSPAPSGTSDEPGSDPTADKVLEDTLAWARALARERGRNAEWAESAVRASRAATAEEALAAGVIDLVAANRDQLLVALEGREVTVAGVRRPLRVAGATLQPAPMSLAYRVLRHLAHPNIAYILLILGFWGLFFEISRPGVILPGVLGAISIILAFLALQVLPTNYAGVLLILLGLGFLVAEVMVVSFGLLAAGGIVSLVLGSLLLFDSPVPGLRVSAWLVVAVALSTACIFLLMLGAVVRVHRTPFRTGTEGLVGTLGVAEDELSPQGRVFVAGELWSARLSDPEGGPVARGTRVRVTAREGLLLFVAPVE